jgi:hypothetical protein
MILNALSRMAQLLLADSSQGLQCRAKPNKNFFDTSQLTRSKSMKMRKLLPLAVLGALAASNAQALVIDTFDDTAQQVIASPPGIPVPQSDLAAAPEAVGGSRNIAITAASGLVQATANTAPTAGAYSHSNASGVTGTSEITWDNAGGGLGGLDLTDGGLSDALQLVITSIDQGDVTLAFEVIDTNSNASTLTLAGLGIGTHFFFLTDFVGTADLTIAASIKLTVNAGEASDLTLDLVRTNERPPDSVPEIDAAAGTGAIALLGGMVALRTERRRRRA